MSGPGSPPARNRAFANCFPANWAQAGIVPFSLVLRVGAKQQSSGLGGIKPDPAQRQGAQAYARQHQGTHVEFSPYESSERGRSPKGKQDFLSGWL
jgi:hypothetical protein